MDLWGQIYLDHWRGDVHPHELVRDDGKSHTIPSAAGYFAAYYARNLAAGRPLD